MILDIDLVLQPKDSAECGVACVAMLISHYDINDSYEAILAGLKNNLSVTGLSAPALGLFLIEKYNLKVELITLNPLLFSTNEIGASRQDVIERVERRQLELTAEKDIRFAKHFLDFLEKGGVVTPEIPSFNRIKTELDNSTPLIAGLTTNFLHGKTRFNFHYNVITGYDESNILANDPNNDETGGKVKFPIDQYLFAIHSTCYGDLDNACLLKIIKK